MCFDYSIQQNKKQKVEEKNAENRVTGDKF
jgi:hypothetical protein